MLRVVAGLFVCVFVCVSAQYGQGRRDISSVPTPLPRPDVIVSFRGVLKQMKKKEILIQGEDSQLLTIRRNKSTRFFDDNKVIKATDIDLDTPVVIEANEDTDFKMLALNVRINSTHKRELK